MIALIAGEDSGDVLGADLAVALRARLPGVHLVGVGGPRMAAAGVDCWSDIAELSVMGLAEVLRHLPRLLRLRAGLVRRLLAAQPVVVVGIDAPDFNLGLERRLKRNGIRTVHYVSPSVWAWRENRARKMGESADQVLCLFPMEADIYARHGVAARFVGHPMADRFAIAPDRHAARASVGVSGDGPVLALLPGSRRSEIERLGSDFITAAHRLAAQIPGLQVLLPAANTNCFNALQQLLEAGTVDAAQSGQPLRVHLLKGNADLALQAADVALVASGTATLECMLAKCPMVVAYRISALTYRLVRLFKLMKTDLYSLPNVLAGHALVPELMQHDCNPDTLARAVADLFHDEVRCQGMTDEFTRLHHRLKGGLDGSSAASHAADAIISLLPENQHRA